jgi:hypothetical protein
LEEIDEMKSSTDVVVGTAATSATIAQAGTTESSVCVCDADMSVVSDEGRAIIPSPDNISRSTSATSKVRCTRLRARGARCDGSSRHGNLDQHGVKILTRNLRATDHYELRFRVHHLPAFLQTITCKLVPEPSTDPAHAHRHTELQGKVCLELLRRDGLLVSTNKCDKDNRRVVRTVRRKLHDPLHDEDLDIGPAINVTRRR